MDKVLIHIREARDQDPWLGWGLISPVIKVNGKPELNSGSEDLLLRLEATSKYLLVGELPDMMSTSEGGGGSWKSGGSKGGCLHFIVLIRFKCRQRGRGSKNPK